MNYEELVEEEPDGWSLQRSNVFNKNYTDNIRGFRPMQHDKNATGTAGVSLSSITPYDSFVQQQQQQQQQPSSGSSLLPTRLISSKSSDLLSSDGGDPPGVQDPLQQQQHQSDNTQKLLAHLSSTISSGPVPHVVTPEQIYIAAAAAEEAKLLETRKQQLLQKLQQQLNSSKVSANGTANAAVAAQLWLQQSCAATAALQQQQQQQQQLANKTNQNQPSIILTNHSTTADLIPETHPEQQITVFQQDVQQQQLQQIAFLDSDYQQLVQNGDLRLKSQSEQQSLSDSKTTAVPQHHSLPSPHPVVHAEDGSSAFRQPRRQQYLLDQNAETQQDRANTATATLTRDCDDTSGFAASSPSSSASSFVTSLSRNHVTSAERDYHNEDGDATESKLVINDVEMTDDYSKTDKIDESYPVSKVADEEGGRERQPLLTTGNSSEIIGISTYATVGAVIHVDNDEFVEKTDNVDEQPKMKSILDFVDGEVEIDVEHKESGEDEADEKPIAGDDDAGSGMVDDSEIRRLVNNIESPEIHETRTGTPFEQTRFTAMRIEERILNEKLTPSTTPSTATTSDSMANSVSPCHRFVPQTAPAAPSPRSESVSSTPSSSTFCRAPGLGPVNTTETQQSGTALPLVCNICGFSCNSKFHYNSHMNTHGDHQCTMCDYTSRTEGRLKKHMRDSHTVEEQLAAGLDVEQVLTSSTSISSTPAARITTTPVDGSNLSTSMASVLEAANLAAAAQAAAQAAAASSSSNSSSGQATSAPSDSGSGLSLPSGSGTPPSSDIISSSLSGAAQSISGLVPSALDQIRAFTENPSVLPDLSSANLATALISQGLLSSQAFHESMKSINSDDQSISPVSGDKPRQCSSKPKTYKCKQCSHISTSKEEQWAHARTHIPVEKQLGCTRCGFVTEYKHHLEYHLRNHMGSKPFHCKKCAYSCVNKSMLNSHMKSHTNIYQFRCRDCTYATKYCHSLKLHLRKYNHNRATDITDSAVSITANITASPSNLCNGSTQAVTESDDTAMRRLSESLAVQSVDSNSPEPLPTTSTMAQELSAALGMTPVVTSNSLNIASHLLFRQQHQMEEMELLLRLKNMAGINPGAMLGISLQCPACNYQAINQGDSLRHQLGHLIGPNGENPLIPLYNIFGMPQPAGVPSETSFESSSNLNEQMEQQDEEMEMSKVEVDDFISGAEIDEKPSITDSEDHIMSDISGESQGSPSSGKSSIDESSSGMEQESDKGAKKRKAGLKLNQIAARLQEKNSPENPGSSDSINDSKYEDLLLSGMKENPMNEMSGTSIGTALDSQEAPSISSLSSTTPLAPQPQIIPPLGMHNELINLSNLNIFQQACIAHMQEMERKLHILEMWRFSCGHCKMAFQDEPLYHIHMGYHGYENPFKCNRCGQACSDFLTFNLHLLQAKH